MRPARSFKAVILLSVMCLGVFGILPKTIAEDSLPYATGEFTSGITRGTVEIRRDAGKWVLHFNEGFVHDGSPDPWVALGENGFQRHGIIGELKSNSGAQKYPIGPKLDPRTFHEVYIWCVEHNTSLGRARLKWL